MTIGSVNFQEKRIVKPKKSRHQKRTEKTKKNLLEAAKSLFAEKGLDLTTIDEITERADTGKGTFYYHFKTKEKLINVLLEDILAGLEDLIIDRCKGANNLEDALDQIIGGHIDFFSRRWQDFVFYIQGRSDLILDQGYIGLETPFVKYIDTIGDQINRIVGTNIPKPSQRRIASAITGFISGYYSFSTISSSASDDIGNIFQPVRKALVLSLVRFVKEALSKE